MKQCIDLMARLGGGPKINAYGSGFFTWLDEYILVVEDYPYHYKENTLLCGFLWNLLDKFIPFLFISEVDSRGEKLEVIAKVFHWCA